MTDKIVLASAGSGYNLAVINENFQKIETALNDRVMYRDVELDEDNSLLSDMDVNGKRLYNLPEPLDLNEAARLQDVQNAISGATSASLISASDGASGSIFTTVQGFITKVLSNIGSSLVGFVQSEVGTINRSVQARLRDTINAQDFGVIGDGVTDDRAAIITAFDTASAAGRILVFPRRTYAVSNWIPVPSNLKVWFEPGAVIKLTGTSTTGDLFTGGRNNNGVGTRNCDNVDIANLTLDVNNKSGTNGIAFINANGVRFYSPRVINSLHSTSTFGGRAIQIEGGVATGVHIWDMNIENCSIGINSHANAAGGTTRAADINYYGVTMRNVDIPFNVDSQFANPQNGIAENMSTTVNGATLWNCGKITWAGGTALGGGIVCGDRGSNLRINGLRVTNETSYGQIGALLRGRVYGIQFENAWVDVPSMTAVYDFNEVGFGAPGTGAASTTAFAQNVTVKANLDYIVKGSTGGVGAARLQCAFAGATATLTGLVDTNAASTTAFGEFIDTDNSNSTGRMTLADIVNGGNTVALLTGVTTGFRFFQHSKTINDESATQFFKVLAPINSRIAISYFFSLMYPVSTNDAALRTETGMVLATIDGSGNATTTVKVTDTAVVLDTVASQTITVSAALSAGEIIISVTQNNESADAPVLCMGTFTVHYAVGSTIKAATITRL